jgi:uncharacterized protein DUF6458
MRIGTSLVLFAVGAILRFAVTLHTSNVNWDIVGDVLMIAGAIGFVMTLLWIAMANRRQPVAGRTSTRAYDDPQRPYSNY